MTSSISRCPDTVEETAFEETDISGTGKQRDDYNCVDGMETGMTRYSLQAVGNLAFKPPRFIVPIRVLKA